MKIHILKPNIHFLSKQVKGTCRKAWRKLFTQLIKKHVHPAKTDVMLWMLMADSGNVILSPRSTNQDEDDPEWESPEDEVGFSIEGLCEELNRFRGEKGRADRERIKAEFYDWVTTAIVDSFQSASIQKLYHSYNPKELPLSIFWSPYQESMRYSKQRLLWSNKGGVTPEQARNKQAELQKHSRYKAVRKKTPSEIKAMGKTGQQSKKTKSKSKPPANKKSKKQTSRQSTKRKSPRKKK